jgi:hypothetical protein
MPTNSVADILSAQFDLSVPEKLSGCVAVDCPEPLLHGQFLVGLQHVGAQRLRGIRDGEDGQVRVQRNYVAQLVEVSGNTVVPTSIAEHDRSDFTGPQDVRAEYDGVVASSCFYGWTCKSVLFLAKLKSLGRRGCRSRPLGLSSSTNNRK